MKPALLVVCAALVAILCGMACGQPRTPESVSDADAGELTCDERARAGVLCRDALRQRCESQGNECEIACDSRNLSANDNKHPSQGLENDAVQCRQDCLRGRDACLRLLVDRCPVPCQ
jgi:hypothetical protein